MVNMEHAWLLPAVPACAFVILALFHGYLPRKGDFIAIGAAIASFVMFLFVAGDLFGQLPAQASDLVNNNSGFDWIKISGIPYMNGNDFVLRIGFHVDQITIVMLSAVTFVGMLVEIYSVGYMKGEVRYGWFYAVVSLFIAAMMTLVLADNFLLLYMTWEGVGICSYLLIGHYHERRSAAEAAKKAFVTTRFGDVLLLIGIILLWREAHTFDMSTIFHMAEAGQFDKAYLTMATLFLFGGAMGKSAQFPFHVWLPDAMEGPTPVSALIHAATMVVAGIYLVARVMPLFEASYDGALYFVVVIGMITTFLSVFMGLVMSDIKRVVAYSTLNSLGLMMIALGFGEKGVGAAMIYLFCHAFFKALLFLGCGSVIHATEKQEVEALGGLKSKMPITNITFLIGAMSMSGLIPFAGFFAKDEILVGANDFNIVALILVLISVPITAAYMMRVYMLTFWGEPKDHHVYDHAHEMPPVMTLPLIALGILASVAGFIVFDGVGKAIGLGTGFLESIDNVLVANPAGFSFDVGMAILSTLLVLGGLAVALYAWSGDMAPAKAAGERFPVLYKTFRNKFYLDDIYQWAISNVIIAFGRLIAVFDRVVVNDTGVNGAGEVANDTGFLLKLQQTGKLPNYALAMVIGVLVLAIVGFSVKG
ncbi:MAG TPA: NADH-quinone oxidoreductase subunit L [Dehalococcoidia bacterium]|nr:NADH-quinone oxidoreductase subunit L [Dehalococcoidia bacterium]